MLDNIVKVICVRESVSKADEGNIYLFKFNNKNTKKGVRYVQS